ncbi:thioredoxin [Halothermothrix orenii]|uniref:Thioredoxin n=1 Tax=Halothermothrix orenii (strain H 168 / OCM 544 / DSM 9562) TaxID=373903 RepID=B8CZ42_HALOH|nr:thioredoxin [Halothermothrix orenii]ACL70561.1 thioredoxin [Halothermothrix orenii H 168]
MSRPVDVTDGNFSREVLKSDKPVVVDFWAEWCAPCRMLTPVIKKIAREYSDKVKVCKLNVDENQSTASRYGVMSIPTIILFENGKVKKQVTGYMPKNTLVKKLGIE